jgi:5-formaminoimidazole-4-carboxamide-1-beta-D-ribofuranosyl 5'-monophosphate synthetase
MEAIAGVNRRSQYNYEQSVRLPDVGYLAALAKQGFDIGYLVTGQQTLRGVIDESLLRNILVAVENSMLAHSSPADLEKKATLIAVLYQTFAETGEIDLTVVDKLTKLAS